MGYCLFLFYNIILSSGNGGRSFGHPAAIPTYLRKSASTSAVVSVESRGPSWVALIYLNIASGPFLP